MEYFGRVVLAGLLLLFRVGNVRGAEVVNGLAPCNFPAIYNFGDSNSDTGGISAAFQRTPPPNGQSFFGKPSGRVCDGRLIIDFIAENLGLPYLSAYLDSIGTNFRHGANFATGGSTIRRQNETIFEAGISPFSLDVQLWHFDQFQERTSEARNTSEDSGKLPKPEEFSKALYILDIGQNDLSVGFRKMTDSQIRASIPDILDHFSAAVQQLYERGARSFWIHNTGPIGCLPIYRIYSPPPDPGLVDPYGCIKSHNDIAMEFNRLLKDKVMKLRSELSHAALTYVDVYAAKYGLISRSNSQGFVDPQKICCGHHESYHVWCGQNAMINGSEVYGAPCGDPSIYISWDSIHYTEAANHWVANHILDGSLSDPPLPITQACHKQVHQL
ncbi:PREDICTED: GDSL esterase/lipase At5g14450 [Nelumbo nucifera]|uniref:GDSL esterase/lipase At5g14450 n=2 Tax=Nelumbo nucifera TaxID=4432 RepID=A0A1U7Z5W4_NELNU|nr:PREDICTED: GDSL esterase/lipase At5g14450 [Nelumbo nucifera]DAD30773.1 TPA_asm: hypothetical protein HUJ06_009624 [Nelumbo nucifera]